MGEVELYAAVFAAVRTPCLLLGADLVVLDANPAYLRTLGRRREDLVGRAVLEAFPPNPDERDTSADLATSLRAALATGRPQPMPLLQYDVETESGSGCFEHRWWSIVNTPVLDAGGAVVALLNTVTDITDVVREQARTQEARDATEALSQRTRLLEADLVARSRELTATAAAESRASQRLAGLARVAIELSAARTTADLLAVVVERGFSALRADGGAIAVVDEARRALDVTTTDSLGEHVRERFRRMPLDDGMPTATAVRTGRTLLLPTRAAALAHDPRTEQARAVTGKEAWAVVPLRGSERVLGAVVAGWDREQAFTPEDVELVEAFAAQCAQALERLQALDAERRAAAERARTSEAIQRSLLTDPVVPGDLQVAVRYAPAAREEQVGGDWYDAFALPGGTTCVVVGDVAGHDRDAAVAMAQVRNVLRGVAHATGGSPAAVLTALDAAVRDLSLATMATAVMADVQRAPGGGRVLRWSSAGHPPPVLVEPDGSARLLTGPGDIVLGVVAGASRHDHTAPLQPGATVLLYTDGLVERRGASLDRGLEWLRAAAEELVGAGAGPDQLCDALLAQVGEVEDDVAVLALRALPDPPGAGGPAA